MKSNVFRNWKESLSFTVDENAEHCRWDEANSIHNCEKRCAGQFYT